MSRECLDSAENVERMSCKTSNMDSSRRLSRDVCLMDIKSEQNEDMTMTVEKLIEALSKWDKEKEVTGMVGEQEGLKIVEVNEPAARVDGPVIWLS
jgi:hypothetical protein